MGEMEERLVRHVGACADRDPGLPRSGPHHAPGTAHNEGGVVVELHGLGSYGYNASGRDPPPSDGMRTINGILGLGGEFLNGPGGMVPTGRSELRSIREDEVVNPNN